MDLESRREIQNTCDRLDSCLESAIDVTSSLSDLYIKNKEMNQGRKIVVEMEKLGEEFSVTYEAARRHLELLKEDTSSESSDTVTIDLLNKVNITNQPETYKKEVYDVPSDTNNKVEMLNSKFKFPDPKLLKTDMAPAYHTHETWENVQMHQTQTSRKNDFPNDITKGMQNQSETPLDYCSINLVDLVNESRMNAQALPFKPTVSSTAHSIGQDL